MTYLIDRRRSKRLFIEEHGGGIREGSNRQEGDPLNEKHPSIRRPQFIKGEQDHSSSSLSMKAWY
jgi:hypothetical protein